MSVQCPMIAILAPVALLVLARKCVCVHLATWRLRGSSAISTRCISVGHPIVKFGGRVYGPNPASGWQQSVAQSGSRVSRRSAPSEFLADQGDMHEECSSGQPGPETAVIFDGFRLRNPFKNPILRGLASVAISVVGWLFGLSAINSRYRRGLPQLDKLMKNKSLPDAVLSMIGVQCDIRPEDIGRIPLQGPCILVSNHPLGALDGLILLAIGLRVRPDALHMAASWQLRPISEIFPTLHKNLLMVDVYSGMDSSTQNVAPMRQAVGYLSSGGLLSVFPAGRVSRLYLRPRVRLADPPWSTTIARLARMTGATVVPIRFAERNSYWFHIVGLLLLSLRVAMLPRELVRKFDGRIRVAIGHPLHADDLARAKDAAEATHTMRKACDRLACTQRCGRHGE